MEEQVSVVATYPIFDIHCPTDVVFIGSSMIVSTEQNTCYLCREDGHMEVLKGVSGKALAATNRDLLAYLCIRDNTVKVVHINAGTGMQSSALPLLFPVANIGSIDQNTKGEWAVVHDNGTKDDGLVSIFDSALKVQHRFKIQGWTKRSRSQIRWMYTYRLFVSFANTVQKYSRYGQLLKELNTVSSAPLAGPGICCVTPTMRLLVCDFLNDSVKEYAEQRNRELVGRQEKGLLNPTGIDVSADSSMLAVCSTGSNKVITYKFL